METEKELLKNEYLKEKVFPKEGMCEHGNWENCYFCNSKIKVLVALSGGVDSSVAVALLKKQGFRVIGAHLQLTKVNQEALQSARKVCEILKIPFHVFDVRREFKKEVIDYFISEYEAGRTPNPCVVCNKKIKFGWLLEKAKKLDCNFVATGHYARLGREITISNSPVRQAQGRQFPNPSSSPPRARHYGAGKSKIQTDCHSERNDSGVEESQRSFADAQDDNEVVQLLKAKDTKKDQTYFLWQLNQEQLKHVLFPIGNYTKCEVRQLAKRFNLPTYNKPESQDICFLGGRDIADFLEKYADCADKTGDIVDKDGSILGKHKGLIYYTIGQRSGIPKLKIKNCPPCREAGKLKIERDRIPPLYVVKLDVDKNELVIGLEKDLYSKKVNIRECNWINISKDGKENVFLAKIRSTAEPASCKIKIKKDVAEVIFNKPQRAISPGQSAVIYKNNEVIGGGIIK